MASSASLPDTEARSARETIVSEYASTVAASAETHGRIESLTGCGWSYVHASREQRHERFEAADHRGWRAIGGSRYVVGQSVKG